jgi:hypothetical protein
VNEALWRCDQRKRHQIGGYEKYQCRVVAIVGE